MQECLGLGESIFISILLLLVAFLSDGPGPLRRKKKVIFTECMEMVAGCFNLTGNFGSVDGEQRSSPYLDVWKEHRARGWFASWVRNL